MEPRSRLSGPAPEPAPDPFDLIPAWSQGEADLDLGRYLLMLRRYWPLALAVFAVVVAVSIFWFRLTPPVYTATSTIQIERRPVGWTNSSNPLETIIKDSWDTEFYPTQHELIRTLTLGMRVVRDLDLLNDERYLELYPVPESGDDEQRLRTVGNRLVQSVTISPRQSTQLVDITFRANSSELAARVANGVATSFIAWRIEAQTAVVRSVERFLETQIKALEADVQRLDEQLRELGSATRIADPVPDESLSSNRQVQALSGDYAAAVSRRIDLESRYRALQNASVDVLLQLGSGSSVEELRGRLLGLERELEQKADIFRPDAPPIQQLEKRIQIARAELDRELQSSREAARREYSSALAAEQGLARRLDETTRTLSSSSLELSGLSTAVATRRALLNDLVKRRSEMQVLARVFEGNQSNVQLVERAYPPGQPISPSLRKILSSGLLGGLVLGLAVALLVGHLDRTLNFPEEVEKWLGVPTLAAVPDLNRSRNPLSYSYRYGYGKKSAAPASLLSFRTRRAVPTAIELLPDQHPELAVAEAYRTLATALLLSSAEELKAVALTSAEPGEGKSATSVNLAVVLSQLGMRVLLIDADFRKPHLHRVFGMRPAQGAVNYLARRAEPESVIVQTSVSGLHLCPTGPNPPNPFALIASRRMGELVGWAREKYDFVVVDTPPVLAVPDASFLGYFSDGVVLCVQAGRTTREQTRSCRDQLQLSGVRILGTVLNRSRGMGRYSSYRYYRSYPSAAERESA